MNLLRGLGLRFRPRSLTARRRAPLVRRIGPIVTPEMLPGPEGENINGPSLIAVPPWVAAPLGRYYLYFAHHAGRYIRLAVADDLAGPWRIHPGGVLPLESCRDIVDHLASPDVHVDPAGRRILMYFHAPLAGRTGQHSFLAESADGLSFTADPAPLGTFYFRVWQHRGARWALGKARLYRSAEGWTGFEPGEHVYGPEGLDVEQSLPGAIRHTAVLEHGGRILVFFTRLGDRPERLLCARLEDAAADWRRWRLGPEVEVLRPEEPWEGADLPLDPGRPGIVRDRQHAVRDPAVFQEDGRCYLLYSIAGERGIAIAELDLDRLWRRLG